MKKRLYTSAVAVSYTHLDVYKRQATWSCGHVPLTCDQVAINPGHVVTLTESVQVRGIEIRQNGQLAMQAGNGLLRQ